MESGLKCLSAFGFWGTLATALEGVVKSPASQMPFGFWVLGNSAVQSRLYDGTFPSQMPFGFWVLGNKT